MACRRRVTQSVTNLRKQTVLLANLPQEEGDKNIIIPLRVGPYSEKKKCDLGL